MKTFVVTAEDLFHTMDAGGISSSSFDTVVRDLRNAERRTRRKVSVEHGWTVRSDVNPDNIMLPLAYRNRSKARRVYGAGRLISVTVVREKKQ